MLGAFTRAVDRRAALPEDAVILIGEPEAVPYDELQRILARLIHGQEDWTTLSVPKPLAAAGAWLEARAEPVIPDNFDQGEEPLIKPFMVQMADDHYELNISLARGLLGWEPRHALRETLPKMVEHLKADPARWYEANGLTPPHWLQAVADEGHDAEELRARHEARFRAAHARCLWAHFLNAGTGTWLAASPVMIGYDGLGMTTSDVVSGVLVITGSLLALSWRAALIRSAVAAVGLWVMAAPLRFWTESAAAYLNGSLAGMIVFALALCVRPPPGVGRIAASRGPAVPKGWGYSPPNWTQRIPIIASQSSAASCRAISRPISWAMSKAYGSRSSPARPRI